MGNKSTDLSSIDRETLNRRMWHYWLDNEACLFLHRKEIELLRQLTPPSCHPTTANYTTYAMTILTIDI